MDFVPERQFFLLAKLLPFNKINFRWSSRILSTDKRYLYLALYGVNLRLLVCVTYNTTILQFFTLCLKGCLVEVPTYIGKYVQI